LHLKKVWKLQGNYQRGSRNPRPPAANWANLLTSDVDLGEDAEVADLMVKGIDLCIETLTVAGCGQVKDQC